MNRDSLLWYLLLAVAVLGYLTTAAKPPTEWSYAEWLQALSFVAAWAIGKLQASPLAGAPKDNQINLRKVGGMVALVLAVGLFAPSCKTMPPNLTPEAMMAWEAGRAVHALDVAREATFSLTAGSNPTVTVHDAREVVLWHQASVEVLAQSPQGWRATVFQAAYVLTCQAWSSEVLETDPCTPRLSKATLTKLDSYIGLVMIALREISWREMTSAEVLAQFQAACKATIARDVAWLAAHP